MRAQVPRARAVAQIEQESGDSLDCRLAAQQHLVARRLLEIAGGHLQQAQGHVGIVPQEAVERRPFEAADLGLGQGFGIAAVNVVGFEADEVARQKEAQDLSPAVGQAARQADHAFCEIVDVTRRGAGREQPVTLGEWQSRGQGKQLFLLNRVERLADIEFTGAAVPA